MGDCIYCGKPAGFLRKEHKECRSAHDFAIGKLREFFSKLQTSNLPADEFTKLAVNIAAKYHVNQSQFRDISLKGLVDLIEGALADHVLDRDEENRIANLQKCLGLTTNDLPDSVGNNLIKSAVLRDLSEGKIPQRMSLDGNLPINFEKGERLVWIFKSVTYSKFRTHTEYVGGSHGVSIRLMKGLSYRIGSYKGEAVKSEYLNTEGVGYLVVTEKNLYFASSTNVLKIPIRKIVGLQPYSDGVAITQSAANARAQFFALDDPMFAINAINKLNQL